MEELLFYKRISGEWFCNKDGLNLGFKYDGFRMYKQENQEWVEHLDWVLLRLTDNSSEVTGIQFGFFNLPDLLLININETGEQLEFMDMSADAGKYIFKKAL